MYNTVDTLLHHYTISKSRLKSEFVRRGLDEVLDILDGRKVSSVGITGLLEVRSDGQLEVSVGLTADHGRPDGITESLEYVTGGRSVVDRVACCTSRPEFGEKLGSHVPRKFDRCVRTNSTEIAGRNEESNWDREGEDPDFGFLVADPFGGSEEWVVHIDHLGVVCGGSGDEEDEHGLGRKRD